MTLLWGLNFPRK
jgi:hypothetical protein